MSFVQFKDAFKASKGTWSPRRLAPDVRTGAAVRALLLPRRRLRARARAHSRAAPFVQIT
jgi:hypothetical protein